MNTRANMNSVTFFCSEKEFFLLVTTYCCTKDCFLCKFWTFSSFLGLVTKKGALRTSVQWCHYFNKFQFVPIAHLISFLFFWSCMNYGFDHDRLNENSDRLIQISMTPHLIFNAMLKLISTTPPPPHVHAGGAKVHLSQLSLSWLYPLL